MGELEIVIPDVVYIYKKFGEYIYNRFYWYGIGLAVFVPSVLFSIIIFSLVYVTITGG